jgi:uncharacterized protein YggE
MLAALMARAPAMDMRSLLVLLAALALASPAPAQGAMQRPFPEVTVSGEATIALTPDLAQATGGVTTEAKTVREASDANAQAMNAVIAALKEAGIADKDVQTSQFTIAPVYAQNRPGREEPRITGYRASNQVRFNIRDIAKVSDVLDRAIAAGATDLRGVTFTVSNASKAKDQARTEAISDARRRAEVYARAVGAQVGRAIAITETSAALPRPMVMSRSAELASAAPPIAPGETTLQINVTVSFELLQ